MERTSYSTYSVGKGKEYPFEFKLDAVFVAQELGIKPASRKFKISVNTTRSWLRRFKKNGKKGLEDQRKGPHNIPNKISVDDEERIVSIRTRAPCFGARRIKHFFNVKCSLSTIQRIIRSHRLTRKRKKTYVKRRDLRAIKAKRPAMFHLQMDLKHLRDIPNYWEQLKPLGLPKYQYTVRDTKSGMLFLGFSDELSELNARTMIDYVLAEMKLDLPFDVKELTVQTDNGSEFSGQARRIETAPFVHMIEKIHGANHVYIRPGHCNANADVESSHELIETEFYDLTTFADREDFFKKVESYRLYFNFVRPIFYKGGKTPEQICRSDWNTTVSYNYSLIKTLDLDRISNFSYQTGQSFPNLAEEQLLLLQQILFFRELGFELKKIKTILKRSDFDQAAALSSHRLVLQKNLERTKKLLRTIDRTIEHLQGTKKMKDHEMYHGFSKEKQAEYEQYLINCLGDVVKDPIEISKKKMKNWSKAEWDKFSKEWDAICKDLALLLKNKFKANSDDVQKVIQRHYKWLPWNGENCTREAYIGLGEGYTGFEWKEAFKPYDSEHPKFARFLAEAMRVFAEKKLP